MALLADGFASQHLAFKAIGPDHGQSEDAEQGCELFRVDEMVVFHVQAARVLVSPNRNSTLFGKIKVCWFHVL
ncbi:MAG: hypothetical protein OXF23_06470 [Candidatus Dadabacteria bacterium]|nr:hypothetical protein [Candidatus Dadabacteria bacterium]